MPEYQIKSYARITLFLDIINKLDNGNHEIDSIKQTISLYDIIKLRDSSKTQVTCKALSKKENLVSKAIREFKKEYKINKDFEIFIEKRIPIRAGLAGGSSNVAYILNFYNKHLQIGLESEELSRFVRKYNLGNDIPYFFYEKTARDSETDKGIEILKQIPKLYLTITKPSISISTKEAYILYDKNNKETKNKGSIEDILKAIKQGDSEGIIKNTYNKFENMIKEEYNEIEHIFNKINKNGSKAFLTGSGSCIITLFKNKQDSIESQKRMNKIAETYLAETC